MALPGIEPSLNGVAQASSLWMGKTGKMPVLLCLRSIAKWGALAGLVLSIAVGTVRFAEARNGDDAALARFDRAEHEKATLEEQFDEARRAERRAAALAEMERLRAEIEELEASTAKLQDELGREQQTLDGRFPVTVVRPPTVVPVDGNAWGRYWAVAATALVAFVATVAATVGIGLLRRRQ